MADGSKFRPCTEADQKAFMAVPGIRDSVRTTLKFTTDVEIIAEAVAGQPDGSVKYLVMAGEHIQDDEDNREGYWWIKDDKILKVQAIVLPTLS
ncbi:hypothetical protein [Streptomyces erythrochromogenes]|uniref:hypothetical protein n=1 Tax=Streptomyces erythrochromogenes TaxID=285574 RepID=UPI00369DE80C